jgi:hypothetical protein
MTLQEIPAESPEHHLALRVGEYRIEGAPSFFDEGSCFVHAYIVGAGAIDYLEHGGDIGRGLRAAGDGGRETTARIAAEPGEGLDDRERELAMHNVLAAGLQLAAETA